LFVWLFFVVKIQRYQRGLFIDSFAWLTRTNRALEIKPFKPRQQLSRNVTFANTTTMPPNTSKTRHIPLVVNGVYATVE
jgi:hypothetical protein